MDTSVNDMQTIPLFSSAGLASRDRIVLSESESCAAEEICSGEWLDWYRLAPLERLKESQKLWTAYLALGGSLDPEPDTQSPFHDPAA